MPRYFVLFLVLMFAAPSWSAPSCNGTTEELLQCYSPEVKDFLKLLSDRPISDEEITSALQSACAEFVLSLPDGLDTMIGEGGSRLSAGERQRLILARSLLQDRPVLILDESMSNLDPQTEAEFLKVLTKLKSSKTIIMISHRHHLAEIADQVITINEH